MTAPASALPVNPTYPPAVRAAVDAWRPGHRPPHTCTHCGGPSVEPRHPTCPEPGSDVALLDAPGVMRARWWSRCRGCDARVEQGAVVGLVDLPDGRAWVCATCLRDTRPGPHTPGTPVQGVTAPHSGQHGAVPDLPRPRAAPDGAGSTSQNPSMTPREPARQETDMTDPTAAALARVRDTVDEQDRRTTSSFAAAGLAAIRCVIDTELGGLGDQQYPRLEVNRDANVATLHMRDADPAEISTHGPIGYGVAVTRDPAGHVHAVTVELDEYPWHRSDLWSAS